MSKILSHREFGKSEVGAKVLNLKRDPDYIVDEMTAMELYIKEMAPIVLEVRRAAMEAVGNKEWPLLPRIGREFDKLVERYKKAFGSMTLSHGLRNINGDGAFTRFKARVKSNETADFGGTDMGGNLAINLECFGEVSNLVTHAGGNIILADGSDARFVNCSFNAQYDYFRRISAPNVLACNGVVFINTIVEAAMLRGDLVVGSGSLNSGFVIAGAVKDDTRIMVKDDVAGIRFRPENISNHRSSPVKVYSKSSMGAGYKVIEPLGWNRMDDNTKFLFSPSVVV